MEQADTIQKQWVKIYPSYIDKALKHSEGRKISATLAVENPSIKEIFAICADQLRLDSKMEVVRDKLNENFINKFYKINLLFQKHHPKDWQKRGRVLVGLKYDGKTVNNDVKTSKKLFY